MNGADDGRIEGKWRHPEAETEMRRVGAQSGSQTPRMNRQTGKLASPHKREPSADPPLVLGNYPLLTWLGNVLGWLVRKVAR